MYALRKARHERGLSLADVAKRADMDISHLSRVERGLIKPTVERLHRLAVILDLPLAQHLAPFIENGDKMEAAA